MRRTAVTVLWLTLHSAAAFADDFEDAQQAAAAGAALAARGDCKGAVGPLSQAYRLAPNAVTAFDLAECYATLDDPDNALANYRRYLRESPPAGPQRTRAEQAASVLPNALAARGVQQVTVLVSPPTAAADVTVDGRPFGKAPATFLLRPGAHEYLVTGEGFPKVTGAFTLTLGKPLDVPVTVDAPAPAHAAGPPGADFGPPPMLSAEGTLMTADRPVASADPGFSPFPGTSAQPSSAVASSADTGPRRKYLGAWIATGATGLGLALGVTMALVANGAQASLRAPTLRPLAENQQLFDTGMATQTTAIVAFSVAGAAAITAALLFLFEGKTP